MLSFALLAAAALTAASPQSGDQRATALLSADNRRFVAMVNRDVPALARLLGDELVYVHSSSTRQTKSEHLGDIALRKATYQRIDVREQVPRVYGDTGVIQGVATFTSGSAAPSAPVTLRYTDVYIWREARWQMIAWHCTRMPDPIEK